MGRLHWNQVLLIATGGVIRGAIAFGLSLQIDTEHAELLKTSTQILVLATTIILGAFMSLITRCLKVETDQEIQAAHERAKALANQG